jgi:DNA-binding beta-propeller fold protein YncE
MSIYFKSEFLFLFSLACFCFSAKALGASEEAVVTTFNPQTRSASILFIDATTHSLESTPIIGLMPIGVAITPNGKKAWVTSDNFELSSVNVETKAVDPGTVTLSAVPLGIAITPNGTAAITASPSKEVSIIDLETRAEIWHTTVNHEAYGVAITPDGTQAFIGTTDNTVLVLNMTTHDIQEITIAGKPLFISITPDGKFAWECNNSENNIACIDIATKKVTGDAISIGTTPSGISITPNGKYIIVRYGENAEYLCIVDASTHQVINPEIHIGSSIGGIPPSIAITPDSSQLWTTNLAQSSLSLLNLTTFASNTITIDSFPFMIAFTPDQAPTASFTSSISGSTAAFDASTSSSPYGIIASYQWNFGDGSEIETTTSPTISHTYGGSGTAVKSNTYTVTLTVTNSSGTSTAQTFTGQTVSNNGGPSAELQQTITVGPSILPPRKFTARAHRKSKKIYLHAKWKKSESLQPAKYQIFAHDNKIATIKAKHHLEYKWHVHPQHFPHHHLSKSYRTYLEGKYKIRIIDTNGNASSFSPLHVHKSVAK